MSSNYFTLVVALHKQTESNRTSDETFQTLQQLCFQYAKETVLVNWADSSCAQGTLD